MMNSKHLAYEKLKKLYQISESSNNEYFCGESGRIWKKEVLDVLFRLFGDNSPQVQNFRRILRALSPGLINPNTKQQLTVTIYQARKIIEDAIKSYETYDLSLYGSNLESVQIKLANPKNMNRKIFIVHGHDNEMKESVARFLEKIDFEAIILHEQASAGDTIIEKFERNADVSYAVVLLSPDDVGAAKDQQNSLQPRARQNVVLELGYFIGKLGRTHVFPLVRQSVEIPSDFSGVVYVPFEGESWKMSLIKELTHLGFEIDANKAFC